ncbi:MAG TPA: hypothetical protein VEY14_12925 [Nocardioidaceae bacterium]|nr:hypothetical protein [Nocardioidaceae bacterium]
MHAPEVARARIYRLYGRSGDSYVDRSTRPAWLLAVPVREND